MDSSTQVEDAKIGYIYGLFASDMPLTLWECRYIGKTVQTLKRRLSTHLNPIHMADGSYRSRWVQSVIARGAQVEMHIIETHAGPSKVELDQVLQHREIAWIASARRNGWRLTNGTAGGDGAAGRIVLPAQRAKISASLMGHVVTDEAKAKMQGRKVSDATRAKQSAAAMGRKNSPESIAKTAAALIGNKHASVPRSLEVRARMSAGQLKRNERLRKEKEQALNDNG